MITLISWYGRTLIAPDVGYAILGHLGVIGAVYLTAYGIFLKPTDWLISALLMFTGILAFRGNIHKARADHLEAERIKERPDQRETRERELHAPGTDHRP